MVANTARLILEPAASVLAVPGFTTTPWRNGAAVAVDIGAVQYDQPRHVVVRTPSADTTLSATLEVGGHELSTANASVDVPPFGDAGADATAFREQLERLAVLLCLTVAQGVKPSFAAATAESRTWPLARCAALLGEGALKQTVVTEALLGLGDAKWGTWGKHYATTLPFMLRLERRSNFRDLCLQGFGRDAKGEDGIFEQLSNEAEMVFAKLKPPTPTGEALVRGEWVPLGRVLLERGEAPSLEWRGLRRLGPAASAVGSPPCDGGGAISASPLRMHSLTMMKSGKPPTPAGPLWRSANSSKAL